MKKISVIGIVMCFISGCFNSSKIEEIVIFKHYGRDNIGENGIKMDLEDVEKIEKLLKSKKSSFLNPSFFNNRPEVLQEKLRIRFSDKSNIIVVFGFKRIIIYKNGTEKIFYLDEVSNTELKKIIKQDKYKFPEERVSSPSKKGSVFQFKNPEILDQLRTENAVSTKDVD